MTELYVVKLINGPNLFDPHACGASCALNQPQNLGKKHVSAAANGQSAHNVFLFVNLLVSNLN